LREERGSAAVTVIVFMPLLVALLAGVVELGALRVIAARISSAADLATLAATDDQDDRALIATGKLRLPPDAVPVARRFFAANLAQIAPHLAATPESAAADADVVAFTEAPAIDPRTGWRYDRPTVRLDAAVPVRVPVFGAFLLPPVVTVNVRSASAAR
jgi:Flp pilus assembly protein TadG